MYQYNEYDQRLVNERAAQFKGQVDRRLGGEILEGEFKPLRLQNGLYMQLHAYMLRVAIPYGLFSSAQLRRLAQITRKYDKAYGHFTTRQNLQINWPQLTDVPKVLAELAEVQMHAIQTSGNCIRNTTSDEFAGIARDELEDPRPYCEIIRQWSTFHPEFAALPRKFKIAVTGTPGDDRAAVRLHDIGIRIVRDDLGNHGFEILVGGGLGRTPMIASVVRKFLPKPELLPYLEAIMRVYNEQGRRDNKYKARIKILVDALGVEEFGRRVEDEFELAKKEGLVLTDEEVQRVAAQFARPAYETLANSDSTLDGIELGKNRELAQFVRNNVVRHRQPGYCAVVVSLKEKGTPPGDVTDFQMERLADLADRYSFGELRATHHQNLVLADVKVSDLEALHSALLEVGLGTANAGKLTDMICCPGLDYCALANARSIPVGDQIAQRFDDVDFLNDLGPISLKMSGCINACGHHHVGHIGILGIDKQGVEHYQLTLGGSHNNDASIGKVVGKAFAYEEIVDAVDTVLKVYLKLRESAEERFLDAYRRVGMQPFKEALYGTH